jgi:hypothetical protein
MSRSWVFLLVLPLLGGMIGCESRLQVIREFELDLMPAVLEIGTNFGGYRPGDLVLALVPMMPFQVKQNRGVARVFAVYQPDARVWASRGPNQSPEIMTVSYEFARLLGISADGIALPKGFGLRTRIRDDVNKVKWVRVGSSGPFINMEVAFDGTPTIVRKVKYQPADDGFSVQLESGATLEVKER